MVYAADSEEELSKWLRQDIDAYVARYAPELVLVHAGAQCCR
jgi:hypothetical protein